MHAFTCAEPAFAPVRVIAANRIAVMSLRFDSQTRLSQQCHTFGDNAPLLSLRTPTVHPPPHWHLVWFGVRVCAHCPKIDNNTNNNNSIECNKNISQPTPQVPGLTRGIQPHPFRIHTHTHIHIIVVSMTTHTHRQALKRKLYITLFAARVRVQHFPASQHRRGEGRPTRTHSSQSPRAGRILCVTEIVAPSIIVMMLALSRAAVADDNGALYVRAHDDKCKRFPTSSSLHHYK